MEDGRAFCFKMRGGRGKIAVDLHTGQYRPEAMPRQNRDNSMVTLQVASPPEIS